VGSVILSLEPSSRVEPVLPDDAAQAGVAGPVVLESTSTNKATYLFATFCEDIRFSTRRHEAQSRSGSMILLRSTASESYSS
jgi:hypothetical protein